jgi:CRISPR-associated protein Csy2
MKTTLLIPRIEVAGANAIATPYLINTCPLFAATGFARALALALGLPTAGVALIHHHAELHADQFFEAQPWQRRGATYIDADDYVSKNRSAPSLSVQPVATYDATLTLAIQFPDEPPPLAAVARFLARGRLAGGQIVGHAPPRMIDDEELRGLRGGFLVVSRADLIDPSDRLAALFPQRQEQPQEDPQEPQDDDPWAEDDPEQPTAWIVPAVVGYALITEPATRAGARDGHPAAFAEPLVAPVQYRPIRSAATAPMYWRGEWIAPDVYLIAQKEQQP